ncbi:MAG TPA: carboxypeptidase-like regulatory domain-containing protein [Candidatus Angelobacter sp.]
MKFTFAIFLLSAYSLHAQIVVQQGKRLQVPVPGATAAVALDTTIADACAENGILSITGIGPGDARVIAMSPSGLQELFVHVLAAPPAYPPGFIPPQSLSSNGGSYESRFSSDRTQFENALDVYSQDSHQLRQFHFVSATFAGGTATSSYVPSIYYRIATHGTDATFFDQTVNDSPLTLTNVVLRGLHVSEGAWQFHGGYAASADFADVFLPTQKEFAAGLEYTQILTKVLKVTPEFYFLRSIDLADGKQRSAVIGSVIFRVHLNTGWDLRGDIAYGGRAAFAGELEHFNGTTQLRARFVEKNLRFPALRSNSLPGLSGELSWSRILTTRLELLSGGTISNIELRTVRQDSQSAYSTVRYKISHSWSAGSGVSYGSFSSLGSYSAKTYALPQQVNFDRTHFGIGFQYQLSIASNSFSNGNGLGQTLRLNLGRFQIGEFLNWQNDALSIASLFSQVPGLQQELQRLGIAAVTPDQLANLLQDAAFLQTLGLSTQGSIITVPHRVQAGANMSWVSEGSHPHQLSISYSESHSAFSTSASNVYNFTGAYSKDLTANNRFQMNGSLLRSSSIGVRQVTPLISVSFRHTFAHAPGIFAAQKNTSITGTVFIDAQKQGVYDAGMAPVPRAAIVLDGTRTVLTDAFGRFRFANVSAGDHKIELHYDPGRDHYFTTPEETVVTGGSTVNFGVAFPTLDLWGYVLDDVGNGLENVGLEIVGTSAPTTTVSDTSGKFCLPNVQPGSYEIKVDPATVPVGYSTVELGPVQTKISATSAAHPNIKIPAIRVLAGTVTMYDPRVGSYVPVEGALVDIPQLSKSVVTSGSGKFVIAGLPPGQIAVKLVSGQSTLTHIINIPIQPVILKDNFRISSLDGQVTFTLASTLD